jgi:predicted O-methyltransferase YrrM
LESAVESLRTGGIVLRNLLLGGSVAALRLGRPRKILAAASENLFFLKTFAGTRGIAQRNVCEMFPAPDGLESIELANLNESWRPYSEPWLHSVASYTTDLVGLCLLCRRLKPKVIFEIGTLRGYTTLHLALNTPDEAKVYTLDLPKDASAEPVLATTMADRVLSAPSTRPGRYCFEGTRVESKITCLFGDSATFDYTPYLKNVDLFFIDGAHSYEYVRSDTLHALRCCRPGGVIAWHDFGRAGINGVSRWLLELARERTITCVPGGSLAFMKVA